MMGHAFYPDPVPFKNSSEGSVFSFSITFVFAIISKDPAVGGPGIAFVAAPKGAFPAHFQTCGGGSSSAVATDATLRSTIDGFGDVAWATVTSDEPSHLRSPSPSLFEGRRFGKIPCDGGPVASHHPSALGRRTQATSP
ncbi:hypothetical protein CRG98_039682 [Punica granatum]|uniref:Legume lectin domain-containing protein n=1 Tax=Punica granatum TaxID=22663 RepID=A0A2I0I7E5_PUNGR|nr:hypothetical protein CRG98_039682 [Punica granatum]